jgi:hypothetical protein
MTSWCLAKTPRGPNFMRVTSYTTPVYVVDFTGALNLGEAQGIHFPELKDIDKPVVWVFPEVVVCLDCGTAEFAVPEAELRQLAKGDAAAAG